MQGHIGKFVREQTSVGLSNQRTGPILASAEELFPLLTDVEAALPKDDRQIELAAAPVPICAQPYGVLEDLARRRPHRCLRCISGL